MVAEGYANAIANAPVEATVEEAPVVVEEAPAVADGDRPLRRRKK